MRADRLRRHPPVLQVDWLPEPGQRIAVVAVRDAPKVAERVRRVHGQDGIVLPLLRVADARRTASAASPAPLALVAGDIQVAASTRFGAPR